MYENSSRLGYSENAIAQILRDLVELRKRLAAVEQQPWSGGGGGDGGQQATAGYFGFTVPAGGLPGGGTATGSVWQINPAGTRSTVTASGTVYHDGPTPGSDLSAGDQAILASNPDGSYTVIGRYCT